MRFSFLHYTVLLCAAVASAQVDSSVPTEIYNGGYNNTDNSTILKIGNGGAGQSGLIRAIGNAYINYTVSLGKPAIKVAWYKSDTTTTINYLGDGTVDVGITYNTAAEQTAIKQGLALSPSYYVFRDHFLLVGPSSNPANISNASDTLVIFTQLHAAAEAMNTDPAVRFLSRYDKSATNIKESLLWLMTGQAPWATAYSTWYHQYIAFPAQALTAAILLSEYTLTDRGTYLSLPAAMQNQTTIYKAGTNDESDLLLLPAHLLVSAKTKQKQLADDFARWMVDANGGQAVIAGFVKGGQVLYSTAPQNGSSTAR